MRTCFTQIFWGLVIVVIDIRINGFDLVADVLGYILIALGAAGLVSLSPQFGIARSLSVLLAVAWLVGLFVQGEAGWLFWVFTAVMMVLLIWTLLGGISEFAIARARPDLAERASNRRLAFVLLTAVATIGGLAAPYSGGVLR